jgi:hypothetical protein
MLFSFLCLVTLVLVGLKVGLQLAREVFESVSVPMNSKMILTCVATAV